MGVSLESNTDCVCYGASRDKHKMQAAMSLTDGTWVSGKLRWHTVKA